MIKRDVEKNLLLAKKEKKKTKYKNRIKAKILW